MNLANMNKKELRAKCDDLGIHWDKQTDNEAILIAKIEKHLSKKKKEVPLKEFDLTQRARCDEVINVHTKEVRLRPTDCFGWLFDESAEECGMCPHAAACKGLSATADIEQLEVEVVELAKKAVEETKAKKAAQKAEKVPPPPSKPEPKDEPLSEKSVVRVAFQAKHLKNVDEDLLPFYQRLLKYGASEMPVKQVLDAFEKIYEVEDRNALLTDLIVTMIDNKELELVG